MLQRPKDAIPSASGPLIGRTPADMQSLIQLRWIAVFGQIATIVFATYVFHMALPLPMMAVVLAILISFNLASMFYWRRHPDVSHRSLFIALLVDVFTLTAQLYLSGGAGNPFVFLYLLQVTLGIVLLKPWESWSLVAITSICFAGLMVWAGPVVIPANYYQEGLFLCFVMDAALIMVFIGRIGRILRARDARLAAMRQRAAEEEHIMRMGLLASGAAHELGTPLSTISVILGDWRRMPLFAQHDGMTEELNDMQVQLDRCKAIVSGILLSAGEMRAESPVRTTVNDFLDDLIAGWRATRPVRDFDYVKRFVDDIIIVSDEGLKQMISNVLDNALEASPDWLAFEAVRNGDDLVLRVSDRGPGFAPEMLKQLGRPYQSSKGRPGGGLGLFLALNVARSLGGNISARNREPNGAVVTMTLPLAALTLEPPIEESVPDEL